MSINTRNLVKKKLYEGKVSLGSWIQIGHPVIAEILGSVGFDWIAADMEHTDIGIREFTELARGLAGKGPIPFARVRENDTLAIRQVLDAGAWGVIVPLVSSAEDAKRAVQAAKFPPEGIRGTAFFRANQYGRMFDEYVQRANEDILVIVMIETSKAVEEIDAIVAVDGVDGVFIGPYDLSLSYGIPGQLSDRRMVEAKKKILNACAGARKAAGLHQVDCTAESITDAVDSGFTFIALGMDTVFIDSSARSAIAIAQRKTDAN
ncbi:MAG TPA: aldolase/citrate lyase family protein [Spirochaetia bacterium]|nr:aldolase/citrate lyase family protein [Spirochaetia bacterium]